ncbi:iron-containing alcohol dehydrogenase family protein [Calorimonas adulescens]|nr:iron-containing alcohol dehydrogenase family protein [Calorimonas adulescens]
MHLVMGSPNRYIQYAGIIKDAGDYIKDFGKRALVVGGHTALSVTSDSLTASLTKNNIDYIVTEFKGEVTQDEIDRVGTIAAENNRDVIIGVGGGKAIDTAKAAANKIGVRLVTIPTIAATCASWTPLSVIYNDEHEFLRYTVFRDSPSLVLVDTKVIAESPARYFAAGISDTLVKGYEAAASSKGKYINVPTRAALSMADLCTETLFEYGRQAYEDVKGNRVSEAVEKTIDAIIALSGMVGGLGSDNCRIAAAHAIHNGFTILPEVHGFNHGEKIAFSTLVQLCLENYPDTEFERVTNFLHSIDQPVTLSMLNLEGIENDRLEKVARRACAPQESTHNMYFEVTPEDVVRAIIEADRKATALIRGV